MFRCFSLLFSLAINPLKKLSPIQYKTIIAFGPKDRRLDIFNKFYKDIKVVETIDNISWSEILFRKIRVISVPDKVYMATPSQKAKRWLVKILLLNLSLELTILNIQDCFLQKQPQKVIYLIEFVTSRLLKFHHPEFSIRLIKGENKGYRLIPIFLILLFHRNQLKSLDKGLTIFSCHPSFWLLKIYRLIYPNRVVIVRLHNKESHLQELKSLIHRLLSKKIIDYCESYYRKDAELLNIYYRPNGVNIKELHKLDANVRSYLLFFIGGRKENDYRLRELEPVKQKIISAYPKISQWMNLRVMQGTSEWVPYESYLTEAIKSEIFIDMFRISDDEGFSYRIPEALTLNRKIITNRKSLLNEPFYSKDRIFIIGLDPIERLQRFLEQEIKPLEIDILSKYDSTHWWSEEDLIDRGRRNHETEEA